MEDGTSLSVMFPITQYIWGPDRVLVKTDVLANEQYYYLYNGHGDVVQIVDVSGNVVNSYDYDVWGNFLKKEETIENHFTYFGQTYDEATGLYYLRARYYDPTIGRFISEDPIKDGYNWYVYGNNNPVMNVDENGLDAIVITDVEGAFYQGHISGLFQDCKGNWYYYYWGNKSAFVQEIKDDKAMNSLSSLNVWLNNNNIYGGKYDYATYIAGDFTDSLFYAINLAQNYTKEQYDVFVRNCMQTTWECIQKGRFYDGTAVKDVINLNVGIRPNSNYQNIGEVFYNFDFTHSLYWKTINDKLWKERQNLKFGKFSWNKNVYQSKINVLEKLYY